MRAYKFHEEEERLAFAQRAAEMFAENEKWMTFSDSGSIEPGELLALRWGADKDCVVVLRIDEFYDVVNYHNIIHIDDVNYHNIVDRPKAV